MMRLEILDKKDRIVATHALGTGLTLLGQSPGAHVHLTGQGVGALHVGIKTTPQGLPVIMDLGGPTPLRVDNKNTLEYVLEADTAMLEIGERRVRVHRPKTTLEPLPKQQWVPVVGADGAKNKVLTIRVRFYIKGVPHDVRNVDDVLTIGEELGATSAQGGAHRFVWRDGKKVFAQVPSEWIAFGGRVQAGKKGIATLQDWGTPVELETDTVYRIFAGPYTTEIMVSNGRLVIGAARPDVLPKELRKPAGVSLASVVIVFALWMLIFGKPKAEVEEPYEIYARIQNVPVEKVPDPEPASAEPAAGGGSGSQATETTAPQVSAPTQSAPSKMAQALTGGLKNLVGNVLSSAQVTNTVLAESGVGQVAAAGGGNTTTAGKLAAVGQGVAAVAGATKLGALQIKGSGQGFSGGSGTGLGTGTGNAIGTGVGNGIGRGGYKLIEEESIVDGGLDKSVIAAVIQNNLSQIKYCYERQLVAEPDLFGKVVVRWQITAAGTVDSPTVKQTTLNSPPAEQCMLTKIAGWKFPQPKNGSRVTVTYPFLFKSTN